MFQGVLAQIVWQLVVRCGNEIVAVNPMRTLPTANRAAIALLALVAMMGGILVPQTVSAASAATLSGYAWSSNIGWISFKGTNYGVTADASGNLSGYAWSSNIGWVSFSEAAGCPQAGCATQPKIDPTTGIVSGWAKAIAADGNGWDGWIKLGGSWAPSVKFTTNVAAGYSWGADVVGWVSWSGPGYAVVENFSSCSATISSNCSLPATPVGSSAGSCSSGYIGTCNYSCSSGGTWSLNSNSCAIPAACSATTIGNCSLPATASGGSAGSCVSSYTGSCNYSCNSGTWNINSNSCAVLNPTVSISAAPTRVQSGQSTKLTWNASDVSACTVTGTNGFSHTGKTGTNISSGAITAQTTFTASCDGGAATAAVTVNVVPSFREF